LARLACVLGRPFHTRDWRGMLAELAPVIALFLLWSLLAATGSGRDGIYAAFSPVMVLLLGMTGALRLQMLASRASGEASELPLLPGLPDRGERVAALDRLARDCALRGPLAGGLLFGVFLFAIGSPVSALILLAVVTACAAPIGRLATLWQAGSGSGSPVFVTVGVLGLAGMVSGTLMSKAKYADIVGIPLTFAWLLLGALATALLPLARRRLLSQQPMKFLSR